MRWLITFSHVKKDVEKDVCVVLEGTKAMVYRDPIRFLFVFKGSTARHVRKTQAHILQSTIKHAMLVADNCGPSY